MGPLWLREAERGRALVARAIASARAAGAVGALPFALWLAARDAATSDRSAVAVALYGADRLMDFEHDGRSRSPDAICRDVDYPEVETGGAARAAAAIAELL